MRQRLFKRGLLCLAVVLILGFAWMTYREKKLVNTFKEMQVGTTENEARMRLGNPWKAGACGQVFGGSSLAGCRKEYVYASPYAPVIPRYWAYRFDDKGRLIDKYQYQSP